MSATINTTKSLHLWRGLPLALLLAFAPSLAQVGEKVATRWTPAGIGTDQYESTPAFTPDGREMFFMRSDPRFERYRVLWSRCVNGAWTTPESPTFAAAPAVQEADPFLTPDGNRLYFISMRHTQRDDDFDIFYVDRASDGSWRTAHRLPEPVNSTGSELLPRAVARDRIYFGSDRAGGFGKMDIYLATLSPDGKWKVSNLGPPVSTEASEYEADISRDERTLILVADRGDRSHLYRFQKRDGEWIEQGRIPARADVFQVGPVLSPRADRLLFAQADAERSGEMFLIDLTSNPDTTWPPACGRAAP